MPFELNHSLFFKRFTPKEHRSAEELFLTVDEEGTFPVLFVGRLGRRAEATFNHRLRDDDPSGPDEQSGGSDPLHGGFHTVVGHIPVTLRIFTPDGLEFLGNEITLNDLKRFRTQRGSPSGLWSYTLKGESQHIRVGEDGNEDTINSAEGTAGLGLTETIQSQSAPALISNAPITGARKSFQFDLFRVGTFAAHVLQSGLGSQWRGTMRLIDPDGVEVERTTTRKLTFDVGLATLNKSRDAAGGVRNWTLEVSPKDGIVAGKPQISATVIGSGRINLDPIRKRIDALLGPNGKFVEIFGENKNDEALARLRFKDVVSVESIDLYGVLESVLSKTGQDPGVDPDDLKVNTVYTLGRKAEEQDLGTRLKVGGFRVNTIDVVIGPGVKLGTSVPAIRVTVAVSGQGEITFHGQTVADITVPGGKLEIEIGIRVSPDGTPETLIFVPDTLVEGHINHAAAVVIAASLPFPLNLISVAEIEVKVGDKVRDVNNSLVRELHQIFSNPSLGPQILMMIFGAHFTYLPVRFEGDDILFEHIAPVELEPKPTPGYRGAIGRTFIQGPTADKITFSPPSLGDTWTAENLTRNIDHIVVVMMENRSYDHVLGYRSLDPLKEPSNGLTKGLIRAIKGKGNKFVVRRLSAAGFDPNFIGLKTRLPLKVNHELADVAEQLKFTKDGPGNKKINSAQGFIDNFTPKLKQEPGEKPHGVVAKDVLGYYTNEELPFLGYLADNYAYCDRYYSSHPGPTFPNRMYSLTGDLQHDRYGFPILDSNHSDNFLLSREQTVFDLMFRKGLTARIYESDPSVAMLRMFARYATDNETIVPLDQLEVDMAPGGRGLPAFTCIEPRMHSHPEDDDHPDADMHRGQIFLKRIYTALTSNLASWEKTLLIITWDEHGGLYDHVIPRVADIYDAPSPGIDGGGGTIGSASQRFLTIPYGVRVPTFVVSPWTMRGLGANLALDHCSILKTVLARFLGAEKPFMSDRVSASNSFETFLTGAEPRMPGDLPAVPELRPLPAGDRKKAPSPTTQIITDPLSRKQMREGPVDYHEISGRWARQLGR